MNIIKQEKSYSYKNSTWQAMSTDPIISNSLDFYHISLGSYNVCFAPKNYLIQMIMSNDTRYKYQIDELFPQLDLDIIALSEVTEDYIKMLLESKWIQINYSIFDPKKPIFKCFSGNLILSRYPMKCYSMYDIINGRIAIGLIISSQASILILSVHLLAYEVNHVIRQQQLARILQGLKAYSDKTDLCYEYFKSAVLNKNIIIMGDLNFHMKSEDKLLIDNELLDLWTETNELENGYTWDSMRNNLIKFWVFDNRRMRLDRIMITEGSTLFYKLSNEKMELFGTKKVFPKRKLSYLMGSDHFGLKVKIGISKNPGKNDHIGKTKIIYNQDYFAKLPKNDGFRTVKTLFIYRLLTLFILLLLLLFPFYNLFLK